jgi:hypothetical protein
MTSKTSSVLSLLGSVPIVTLGLLIVTFAILKGPWPPDQPTSFYGLTVSHFERLQGKQIGLPPNATAAEAGRTPVWYARRIFDGVAIGLLVAGYVSVAAVIWFNEWRMLIVLMGIAVVGIVYGGLVGLYAGPILTTGGFALILFGAGLSWASQYATEDNHHDELVTQTERDSSNYDTHFAAQS